MKGKYGGYCKNLSKKKKLHFPLSLPGTYRCSKNHPTRKSKRGYVLRTYVAMATAIKRHINLPPTSTSGQAWEKEERKVQTKWGKKGGRK